MLSQPLRLNNQCNGRGPDLTHISCFVWDFPLQLIHSAGLIIFVSFCCSVCGLGQLFAKIPRGLISLFKCPSGEATEAENVLAVENQQQLLIVPWNLSEIFPVFYCSSLGHKYSLFFIYPLTHSNWKRFNLKFTLHLHIYRHTLVMSYLKFLLIKILSIK